MGRVAVRLRVRNSSTHEMLETRQSSTPIEAYGSLAACRTHTSLVMCDSRCGAAKNLVEPHFAGAPMSRHYSDEHHV